MPFSNVSAPSAQPPGSVNDRIYGHENGRDGPTEAVEGIRTLGFEPRAPVY